MARIDEYRQYIQQILEKYRSYKPPYDDIELVIIRDTEHDHYQLVSMGWHGQDSYCGGSGAPHCGRRCPGNAGGQATGGP